MIVLALAWAVDARAMTLDDAWSLALDQGEESAILTEQAFQARLYNDQALGAVLPKVVLGANYTVNEREVILDFASMVPEGLGTLFPDLDFGEPTVIQKKTFFDANLSILQPIVDARAFAGISAARHGAAAGAAQAESGRADLRLGVAQAYWGVLLSRDAVAVATEGVALAEKHLAQARAVVAAGAALRQAEIQAELAVSRARRDLAAAQARVAVAEGQLAALVPAEAGAFATLEEPLARTPAYDTLEAAVAAAYTERPDLRAAEHQATAARRGAQVSKLGWVPTLDARFTEVWTENTSFVGEPWNWQFGLAAKWILWDGGYRLVDNKQTGSQSRIADAALERLRQSIEVEVEGAWLEVARARDGLAAAERELALADENLRLTEATFGAGESTFLDLEGARVGRDSARLQVLAERMALHLGLLSLARATGSL